MGDLPGCACSQDDTPVYHYMGSRQDVSPHVPPSPLGYNQCNATYQNAMAVANDCMTEADASSTGHAKAAFDIWQSAVCSCADAFDVSTDPCTSATNVGSQIRDTSQAYQWKC